MRFLIAAVAIAAIGGSASAQGETGFLRGRGNLDAVVSVNYDSFDEFFLGPSPVAPPITGVERTIYSLYAAYGVTDNIDLVTTLAWVDAQADAENFLLSDESGLQNATVGIKARLGKWRLGPGNFSVVASPAVKFPVRDFDSFEDNPINALGHNQVDLRARLIAQYQLDSGSWFAIEGGYDRRNGTPADEIPLNVTLGVNVLDRLTISPFYSLNDSRGETDTGLETTGIGFDRYGVGFFLPITDGLGLSGNVRRTDEGRNVSDGFSFGLVLRF